MEQLKVIKQQLVSAVQGQMGDISQICTKEMGEVIDMIKDLEEAMYYCSITEAMEKSEEEKRYYTPRPMMYYSDQPRDDNGQYMSMSNSNTKNYVPYMEYAPYMMKDASWRESHMPERSSQSRRMYMEGKQYHGDEEQSIKELEHYVKDLGDDITEMLKDSSTAEKQVLSNKLQQLAQKVMK